HYLADGFRSYWSGTGDSKALKAIREDTYAGPVSAKAARYYMDTWYREALEAKPPRGNPKTRKLDAKLTVFLKAYAAASGIAPCATPMTIAPALDPAILSGAGFPATLPSNAVLLDAAGRILADVGPSVAALAVTPARAQIENYLGRRFHAMTDLIVAHFAFR
ncbi:MAG: hypothetical protein ACREQ5_16280, partial [Candidatus Dormibacteria bacterium]